MRLRGVFCAFFLLLWRILTRTDTAKLNTGKGLNQKTSFKREKIILKKEPVGMRSALKDTTQRNKSLAGFVKCTSCVKFAFSE